MLGYLSVGVPGAREIRKYDAGRRHRRPRVQKQVRDVGSNVPTTFYGDWEALARISWKSPKNDFFLPEIVLFATPASESNSSPSDSCRPITLRFRLVQCWYNYFYVNTRNPVNPVSTSRWSSCNANAKSENLRFREAGWGLFTPPQVPIFQFRAVPRVYWKVCKKKFESQKEFRTSEGDTWWPSPGMSDPAKIPIRGVENGNLRKTSPSVTLTGKGSKNERIAMTSRSLIFWPIWKIRLQKKVRSKIFDFFRSENFEM